MNNKFELIAKVKASDFENDKGTYKKVKEYYIKNEWYPVSEISMFCFYLATKTINLVEDYIEDVSKYFETIEPMVDIECFVDSRLGDVRENIPRISQIPYSWITDLEEGDIIFSRFGEDLVMFAAYQESGDLGKEKIRFEDAVKMLEKAY